MNLKELRKKAEERRAALMREMLETDDRETRNSINVLIQEQDELIRSYDALIEEEERRAAAANNADPVVTSAAPVNAVPMAQFNMNDQRSEADPHDTLEYRNAFMAFCQTGAWNMRADAVTVATDGSRVIPTTIVREIVRELKVRGVLFNRVRKLNVQGGVEFPILSLKPVANWITETAPSERQKVQANTSVSFNYYGLECKVATSLIVSITSLPEFEETIKELIVEAMITALDNAIIAGTGSGQPLGITKDSKVTSKQKVSVTAETVGKWATWKGALAKIPLAYKACAVIAMAAQTWEQYVDGMTDEQGQPIARTNYGITDGIQERFAGKEVLQVEPDTIKDFDSAASGDVIAIIFRPSDYGINSNLELVMKRYYDEDKNQWVDKAIMVADGKLVDATGVILITKGASA